MHIAIILCKLQLLSRFINIHAIEHLYKVRIIKLIKHLKEVKWVSTVMATHLHAKTLTSTCLGKRQFRFKVRILPTVEKISDLTVDAGSVHILLICTDRLG